MGKRRPIYIRGKVVVDALREGRKTFTELKNLGIPEATLRRILKKYLEYWGLASKVDGFWTWYEGLEVFDSWEKYQIAIEHSHKLLPGLRNILDLDSSKNHELRYAVEEHLRSYPEIWKKLERFNSEKGSYEISLLRRFKGKIIPKSRFMIKRWEKQQGRGLLGTLFGKRVLKIDDETEFLIGPFEKGSEEDIEAEKVIRSLRSKSLAKILQTYNQLVASISTLILKIEMGTPINGQCSLCPKVAIRQ